MFGALFSLFFNMLLIVVSSNLTYPPKPPTPHPLLSVHKATVTSYGAHLFIAGMTECELRISGFVVLWCIEVNPRMC